MTAAFDPYSVAFVRPEASALIEQLAALAVGLDGRAIGKQPAGELCFEFPHDDLALQFKDALTPVIAPAGFEYEATVKQHRGGDAVWYVNVWLNPGRECAWCGEVGVTDSDGKCPTCVERQCQRERCSNTGCPSTNYEICGECMDADAERAIERSEIGRWGGR